MAEDIENHILVPKHELLSEEEAAELLKKLNANIDDLPKIKKNDAAIKKLKTKINDIIKITRSSPTAEETIYYRVVKK
jgi:DNA-directed RNA polymerase subunit H